MDKMNKMKRQLGHQPGVVIIGFLFLLFWLPQESFNDGFVLEEIPEKEVRLELAWVIGSGDEGGDFYQPTYFTLDNQGKIYVLDAGNSQIKCFSPAGKLLFAFGRFGQGPGEFSKNAAKLKYLEDGRLYLIDNHQRRIIIFSPEGRPQKVFKLKFFINDIAWKKGRYYLADFIPRRNHHPLHFTSRLDKIEGSFGRVVEPTRGIFKVIQSLPAPIMVESEFALYDLNSLVVTSREEVIYSQRWPYYLAKYDRERKLIKELIGQTDFDLSYPLELEVKGEWVVHKMKGPVGEVFDLIIRADDSLVVPYINPERTFIYFDFYDRDLRLVKRYKLASVVFDPRSRTGLRHLYLDSENRMYCLVVSREDFPALKKYKLLF